jgi:excisionase family DNA binding protein
MSATMELAAIDEEFYNALQAATFLEISKSTFNRIRISKGIPEYRIGKHPKFKVEDLIAFRESQRRVHGVSSVKTPSEDQLRIKLPRKK